MNCDPVPAQPVHLCRYAAYLAADLAYTSIVQYLNGVRLLHLERNLPNPLSLNHKLACVLRGIRRVKGDRPKRKQPLTPALLADILSSLDLKRVDHSNIWAAILVAFFGLLRRSNVAPRSQSAFNPEKNLRRCDLVLRHDCLLVRVRWSKTIQFKQRELLLPLPRLRSHPLCPYQAVAHAFLLSPAAPPDGAAFVSSNVAPFGAVTADMIVSTIKSSLAKHGHDPTQFAGHSLRRGGATFAYQCGVDMDMIRQLGDWRSNAYTAYVLPVPTKLVDSYSLITKWFQQTM